MDELWSYLKRKKCQLWVFISLEVSSRFWLGFELGARTLHTANRLVAPFKGFGNGMGETILKVTTDKLAAYKMHWKGILQIGLITICKLLNDGLNVTWWQSKSALLKALKKIFRRKLKTRPLLNGLILPWDSRGLIWQEKHSAIVKINSTLNRFYRLICSTTITFSFIGVRGSK